MSRAATPATAQTPQEAQPRIPVVRRSLATLRPWWGRLACCLVLLVASTACTLAGPWVLRYAIDNGLDGTGSDTSNGGVVDLGVIDRAAAGFAALAVLGFVLGWAQTRLAGQIGEQFVRRLRRDVFDHLLQMSTRFFDRNAGGRLVARMTSDVDALQDALQIGVLGFVQNVLTLVLIVAVLLVLSWQLALVCLLPAPVLVVATRIFRRHSRRAYLTLRDRVGITMGTFAESLAGVRVVQAFRQEDRLVRDFGAANRDQLEANLRAVRVQAYYLPVMELTTVAAMALTLGVGGGLAATGQVSVGTVSAFVLYLIMAFEPVQSLSFLFTQLQAAGAALQKLYGLLEEPVDLPDGASTLPRFAGLRVRGLGHRYSPSGEPVLHDVDLDVPHGQRLALVGPSGAGKSTLARLIARLDDPTEGSVSYGGVDLRQAAAASRRERIAMLTQEVHVFAGSVADNVRVVRPHASDADVVDALRRVGALERFERLPGGVNSPVGRRGALLSAGERQLIALARVALLDCDVLIVDEATSNLDPITEAQVTAAMEAGMRGRTVIVIAHRLSTIRTADRVAVVSGGGISELGTVDELLALDGRFAALYRRWPGAAAQAEPA